MSIPVPLERLRAEIQRFDAAPYLLTVDDEGRSHCVAMVVAWDGERLVAPVGDRTRANAEARPLVSLLWPPNTVDGFSLIVDATVTTGTASAPAIEHDPVPSRLVLEPTWAVLHRPAPRDATAQEPMRE